MNEEIESVQVTEHGYLVNGIMNVPNAPNNRHYAAVQEWIANGNVPDPDPATQLPALKENQKRQITRWRDEAKIQSVDYSGNTYDADLISQANLNSTLTTIQAGVVVPNPLPWRDANNVTQSLSHIQLAELSAVMFTQVNDAYSHSWDLKIQVDNATDEASINAIAW